MSSNAGRRCSKIVIPSDTNSEEKLIGGLKNALDRGETLAKAKQSFINAGYKPEDVAMAAQKMPTITSPVRTQIKSGTTPNSLPTNPVTEQPKTFSKTLKIILILVSIIILAGAVVLGLFWDKIF